MSVSALNLNTVHSMSGEIVAIEHSEMKKSDILYRLNVD